MSSNKKARIEMPNEIPADAAAYAQKSVDQAQAAFEKANDLAHSNAQVFDAAASAPVKARWQVPLEKPVEAEIIAS